MRAETKPKKRRVDRNEVVFFVEIGFICAWCFEVIWCVWYRKVCRDISWHHVRYHAISQGTVYRDIVQVSYLYPEFLGLMWRYRIPWIYFSISNTIFCQLGAPSLVREENKITGYLAVELQKQWCYSMFLIWVSTKSSISQLTFFHFMISFTECTPACP